MTKQELKVAITVRDEPKSIKEVQQDTDILEPNVRRILGVGKKQGVFERIKRGVYQLTKNGERMLFLHLGNALTVLPELIDEGVKAKMVFLDIPYKTNAVTGGNRGIKYKTISPEEFKTIASHVSNLLKDDTSAVVFMHSKAKSGLNQMQKYTQHLIDEFKIAGEGNYYKYQKDGKTRVRNMRGHTIEPEGIIIFSKSGRIDINDFNIDFHFIRPKGYQTEKPEKMVSELIKLTTKVKDTIIDAFAGSGVVGKEGVLLNRVVHLIEISKDTIQNFTIPKILQTIS